MMHTSLLSGGADANSSRLTTVSRGRFGDAFGVSSRRVSRLALLRACRASPLIVCAVGERSYNSHKGRGGAPRVPSPSRSTELNATSVAKLLNARISRCSSGEELLSLVEEHATSFDFIHASTALVCLAHLEPVETWKHDFRMQLLIARAGELLEQMGGQALANSLWACSKLGVTPAWLPRWVELSRSKLAKMNSLDLSNILYSMALLKEVPDALWMDAFWIASKETMAEFQPQHFSNIIWAAATLGCSPPADWLAHFCDVSKEKVTTFTSQNFSNTIWAFAELRHRPTVAWLQPFFDISLARLPDFNAQALSSTLWALAELGVVPFPEWMDAWATRVAAVFNTFSSQGAVNILWALTVLQMQDSDVFRSLLLQALQLLTPDSDGRELCSLYDVLQFAAAEKVVGLPTPDAILFDSAKKAWDLDIAETAQQHASVDHIAVMSALKELGVAHEQEHFCLQSGRSIDIALLDRRIAIEVDGPSHYLNTRRRTGKTLLRNRVLTGAGWRVVSIPFFEWRALKSMSAQNGYIQQKLSSTGR